MITAGVSGGARNGAVALAESGRLLGVCSQERVTRIRRGGVTANGLPNEALDLLLQRLRRPRTDVTRYVFAEPGSASAVPGRDFIGHHFAHASTAFLTSPFPSSAVVVCDHEPPMVTVWKGEGTTITPVDVGWRGAGFAEVLSRVAALLGFRGDAADQRLEALARLAPNARDERIDGLLRMGDGEVVVDPSFEGVIAELLGADPGQGSLRRAAVAASIQARLGMLLLELLAEVRRRVGSNHLCVGGNLFYHSSMNSRVKCSGLFEEVFVPVDPGNAGLAVGAVLQALETRVPGVSPFLGPSYSSQETKEILDNCKLQYSWESEEGGVTAAVKALLQGRLVGWFDGPMEWGPRALGARCILASPLSPYVLENLNHFLKRRESWRGYSLSGLAPAVGTHFDGPAAAPFMECDYRPRDHARFQHALPSTGAAVRVHTVAAGGLPRFARLLEAFGEASGLPFLINTSFNGFHEPIVCSPRDAVRVFFGTGLDVLVMNQFVLSK